MMAKKKRKTSKTQTPKKSSQTVSPKEVTDINGGESTLEQDSARAFEVEQIPIQLDPNVINVPFSKDELANMINLIGISTRTFEALALAAADQGDNTKFLTLSTRYQMLATFGNKLQQVYQIGEPTSQSIH
jgi:hypothetical protein